MYLLRNVRKFISQTTIVELTEVLVDFFGDEQIFFLHKPA